MRGSALYTCLAFLQRQNSNKSHAYAYFTHENTAKNTPKHANVWLIIVCEIDFGETPAIIAAISNDFCNIFGKLKTLKHKYTD